MEKKPEWRRHILQKRLGLSPGFIREASRKIASRLFSLDEFGLCVKIGLYAPFRNEADSGPVFQKASTTRREIFYPAVDPATKEILFYRVRRLSDLKPGFAGIPEPRRNHPLSDINYLDLLLVPGVAFDRHGNRLGYGAGYYDRLLKSFRGSRIALAYEFQVCDELPAESRDENVDLIVTEERIVRVR